LELPVLFPMVVGGLKGEDGRMRRSAAESLCNILAADVEAAAGQLQGLVPPLLQTAVSSQFISARVAAVGCLVELLRLPHHSVFPFKESVIEQLAGVLDDPKFKVRKAAVRCRNRWITMTPPE